MINIDYEDAIDFGHCETLNEARDRLSQLTNLLNRIIMVQNSCKKDILSLCGEYPDEKLHKLSWDNKLARLLALKSGGELIAMWQDAETAYRRVRNKQSQVFEDINGIKKIMGVTPN